MLAAGTTLGPYRIVAPLGAGGMGEVYRARDTRLARDVAVKVIPSELAREPERLQRFEQEARAAGALSHPNVCAIYDVGTHEGAPYVVMELLEGESLRSRLSQGPLPARKAIDYAAQAARGLAAAHEKGIVHRDLKPENLFLTKDGRVKVLDFGLAKLTRHLEGQGSELETISAERTATGAILGTVGYMSPEQVRGERADHRSDLFALGAILYELVTGRRAFTGATYVDTLGAILNTDPPPLTASGREVPPALEPIVRRCLEKGPGERFQNASDLAFALENFSGSGSGAALAGVGVGRGRRDWRSPVLLATAVAAVALSATTAVLFQRQRHVTDAGRLRFTQLTFERGPIANARFSPDGKTVIYSANWLGRGWDIYETRPGFMASRSLGLSDAVLFSISNTGRMAVRPNASRTGYATYGPGVLAEVPMTGGTPRPVLEDVFAVDWQPGTSTAAVVRREGNKSRVEMPPGRVRYETLGVLFDLRFSPDGRHLALFEAAYAGITPGHCTVIDTAGKVLARSEDTYNLGPAVWSKNGREVWFSASQDGANWDLRAMSLAGRQRVVARFPGSLMLLDVARDGTALLMRGTTLQGILARRAGEPQDRELGTLIACRLADVSADGTQVLFDAQSGQGDAATSVFLRGMDGSPPVRLGEGIAHNLSPDGKWALATQNRTPPQLVLFPTGAGDSIVLPRGGIETYEWNSGWMPDSKRLFFHGVEPGHRERAYVQDISGGPPRPLAPEGIRVMMVSPDGERLLYRGERAWYTMPVGADSGRVAWERRPGLGFTGVLDTWSPDGRWIYVTRGDSSGVDFLRRHMETGQLVPWRRITFVDQSGLEIGSAEISADGESYAVGYSRSQSDLFLVEGLR